MAYTKELKSSVYQQVKDQFLRGGLSAREITDRFNGRVTYSSVRTYVAKIIRQAKDEGIHIAPRKTGASAIPKTSMTPVHFTVGIKLLQHRLITMGGIAPAEYVEEFKIGNQLSLSRMEHGVYDFKLSELVQIANNLEVDLHDLLTAAKMPAAGAAQSKGT